MKVVKEKIKATSVDYCIDIEHKGNIYQIVFWYDLCEDDYNNMELKPYKDIVIGKPFLHELSEKEVDEIKKYALEVWKNTDLFIYMKPELIKRKYFV
jgi:hypothetical protein